MKRLLAILLICLAAMAASADIRTLMKARGYSSPYQSQAKVMESTTTSMDAIEEQPSPSSGCSFPATFPCTFGG